MALLSAYNLGDQNGFTFSGRCVVTLILIQYDRCDIYNIP